MPATEIACKNFDYDKHKINKETKSKLIRTAGDINRAKDDSLKSMMAMGESIGAAHELLAKNGSGTFRKWIEAECHISHQTAYNCLRAWEKFGQTDCKSLLQMTSEAMYALSAPTSTPEALKKAVEMANKGIKVDAKVARSLLPPKQPKSPKVTKSEPDKSVIIDRDKCEEEDLAEADKGPEELCEDHNHAIESAARKLTAAFNDLCPVGLPYLTDTLIESAKSHLKACCGTLRQAKCSICPKCEGAGCRECKDHGFLPTLHAKQLGRIA